MLEPMKYIPGRGRRTDSKRVCRRTGNVFALIERVLRVSMQSGYLRANVMDSLLVNVKSWCTGYYREQQRRLPARSKYKSNSRTTVLRFGNAYGRAVECCNLTHER